MGKTLADRICAQIPAVQSLLAAANSDAVMSVVPSLLASITKADTQLADSEPKQASMVGHGKTEGGADTKASKVTQPAPQSFQMSFITLDNCVSTEIVAFMQSTNSNLALTRILLLAQLSYACGTALTSCATSDVLNLIPFTVELVGRSLLGYHVLPRVSLELAVQQFLSAGAALRGLLSSMYSAKLAFERYALEYTAAYASKRERNAISETLAKPFLDSIPDLFEALSVCLRCFCSHYSEIREFLLLDFVFAVTPDALIDTKGSKVKDASRIADGFGPEIVKRNARYRQILSSMAVNLCSVARAFCDTLQGFFSTFTLHGLTLPVSFPHEIFSLLVCLSESVISFGDQCSFQEGLLQAITAGLSDKSNSETALYMDQCEMFSGMRTKPSTVDSCQAVRNRQRQAAAKVYLNICEAFGSLSKLVSSVLCYSLVVPGVPADTARPVSSKAAIGQSTASQFSYSFSCDKITTSWQMLLKAPKLRSSSGVDDAQATAAFALEPLWMCLAGCNADSATIGFPHYTFPDRPVPASWGETLSSFVKVFHGTYTRLQDMLYLVDRRPIFRYDRAGDTLTFYPSFSAAIFNVLLYWLLASTGAPLKDKAAAKGAQQSILSSLSGAATPFSIIPVLGPLSSDPLLSVAVYTSFADIVLSALKYSPSDEGLASAACNICVEYASKCLLVSPDAKLALAQQENLDASRSSTTAAAKGSKGTRQSESGSSVQTLSELVSTLVAKHGSIANLTFPLFADAAHLLTRVLLIAVLPEAFNFQRLQNLLSNIVALMNGNLLHQGYSNVSILYTCDAAEVDLQLAELLVAIHPYELRAIIPDACKLEPLVARFYTSLSKLATTVVQECQTSSSTATRYVAFPDSLQCRSLAHIAAIAVSVKDRLRLLNYHDVTRYLFDIYKVCNDAGGFSTGSEVLSETAEDISHYMHTQDKTKALYERTLFSNAGSTQDPTHRLLILQTTKSSVLLDATNTVTVGIEKAKANILYAKTAKIQPPCDGKNASKSVLVHPSSMAPRNEWRSSMLSSCVDSLIASDQYSDALAVLVESSDAFVYGSSTLLLRAIFCYLSLGNISAIRALVAKASIGDSEFVVFCRDASQLLMSCCSERTAQCKPLLQLCSHLLDLAAKAVDRLGGSCPPLLENQLMLQKLFLHIESTRHTDDGADAAWELVSQSYYLFMKTLYTAAPAEEPVPAAELPPVSARKRPAAGPRKADAHGSAQAPATNDLEIAEKAGVPPSSEEVFVVTDSIALSSSKLERLRSSMDSDTACSLSMAVSFLCGLVMLETLSNPTFPVPVSFVSLFSALLDELLKKSCAMPQIFTASSIREQCESYVRLKDSSDTSNDSGVASVNPIVNHRISQTQSSILCDNILSLLISIDKNKSLLTNGTSRCASGIGISFTDALIINLSSDLQRYMAVHGSSQSSTVLTLAIVLAKAFYWCIKEVSPLAASFFFAAISRLVTWMQNNGETAVWSVLCPVLCSIIGSTAVLGELEPFLLRLATSMEIPAAVVWLREIQSNMLTCALLACVQGSIQLGHVLLDTAIGTVQLESNLTGLSLAHYYPEGASMSARQALMAREYCAFVAQCYVPRQLLQGLVSFLSHRVSSAYSAVCKVRALCDDLTCQQTRSVILHSIDDESSSGSQVYPTSTVVLPHELFDLYLKLTTACIIALRIQPDGALAWLQEHRAVLACGQDDISPSDALLTSRRRSCIAECEFLLASALVYGDLSYTSMNTALRNITDIAGKEVVPAGIAPDVIDAGAFSTHISQHAVLSTLGHFDVGCVWSDFVLYTLSFCSTVRPCLPSATALQAMYTSLAECIDAYNSLKQHCMDSESSHACSTTILMTLLAVVTAAPLFDHSMLLKDTSLPRVASILLLLESKRLELACGIVAFMLDKSSPGDPHSLLTATNLRRSVQAVSSLLKERLAFLVQRHPNLFTDDVLDDNRQAITQLPRSIARWLADTTIAAATQTATLGEFVRLPKSVSIHPLRLIFDAANMALMSGFATLRDHSSDSAESSEILRQNLNFVKHDPERFDSMAANVAKVAYMLPPLSIVNAYQRGAEPSDTSSGTPSQIDINSPQCMLVARIADYSRLDALDQPLPTMGTGSKRPDSTAAKGKSGSSQQASSPSTPLSAASCIPLAVAMAAIVSSLRQMLWAEIHKHVIQTGSSYIDQFKTILLHDGQPSTAEEQHRRDSEITAEPLALAIRATAGLLSPDKLDHVHTCGFLDFLQKTHNLADSMPQRPPSDSAGVAKPSKTTVDSTPTALGSFSETMCANVLSTTECDLAVRSMSDRLNVFCLGATFGLRSAMLSALHGVLRERYSVRQRSSSLFDAQLLTMHSVCISDMQNSLLMECLAQVSPSVSTRADLALQVAYRNGSTAVFSPGSPIKFRNMPSSIPQIPLSLADSASYTFSYAQRLYCSAGPATGFPEAPSKESTQGRLAAASVASGKGAGPSVLAVPEVFLENIYLEAGLSQLTPAFTAVSGILTSTFQSMPILLSKTCPVLCSKVSEFFTSIRNMPLLSVLPIADECYVIGNIAAPLPSQTPRGKQISTPRGLKGTEASHSTRYTLTVMKLAAEEGTGAPSVSQRLSIAARHFADLTEAARYCMADMWGFIPDTLLQYLQNTLKSVITETDPKKDTQLAKGLDTLSKYMHRNLSRLFYRFGTQGPSSSGSPFRASSVGNVRTSSSQTSLGGLDALNNSPIRDSLRKAPSEPNILQPLKPVMATGQPAANNASYVSSKGAYSTMLSAKTGKSAGVKSLLTMTKVVDHEELSLFTPRPMLQIEHMFRVICTELHSILEPVIDELFSGLSETSGQDCPPFVFLCSDTQTSFLPWVSMLRNFTKATDCKRIVAILPTLSIRATCGGVGAFAQELSTGDLRDSKCLSLVDPLHDISFADVSNIRFGVVSLLDAMRNICGHRGGVLKPEEISETIFEARNAFLWSATGVDQILTASALFGAGERTKVSPLLEHCFVMDFELIFSYFRSQREAAAKAAPVCRFANSSSMLMQTLVRTTMCSATYQEIPSPASMAVSFITLLTATKLKEQLAEAMPSRNSSATPQKPNSPAKNVKNAAETRSASSDISLNSVLMDMYAQIYDLSFLKSVRDVATL